MKLFSNSRAQRNTAFVVLLVWLFALASGVANACLLEALGTHSHAASSGSAGTTHTPGVLTGHDGAVAGHHDDSDTSRAPCLKVCDDGSRSLPKQHSGVDLTGPGPAPLVVVLRGATMFVVPAPSRMDDLQPPAPALPFRVRYSRLAL